MSAEETALFNNREIAIAIWLFVCIGFAASNSEVRSAAVGVWKALCNRLILILFGLMVSYIALVVLALYRLGAWDSGQLKNTILWGATVALVSLFRIPQIAEDEHYFRNALWDNFKVVALIEFVVGFYTFSLWAELLIVPVTTILVALHTFSGSKKEYKPVEALLGAVLALAGFGLIVYAGYSLVTDFWRFAKPSTLSDVTLPILLSLLFLPFLFVLSIYVNFETTFRRLEFTIRDPALRRYAKRTSLFSFHFRSNLLRRWRRNIGNRKPTNREELDASIALVKTQAQREENPEVVPIKEGWSPHLAREFLTDEGLAPSDYHQDPLDDQQWFASSQYLEVGDGLFPNNITYTVEGDERIARRLKLAINYNDPEAKRETHDSLAKILKILFQKALGEDAPDEIEATLRNEASDNFVVGGKSFQLLREDWPTGKGYTMRLILAS